MTYSDIDKEDEIATEEDVELVPHKGEFLNQIRDILNPKYESEEGGVEAHEEDDIWAELKQLYEEDEGFTDDYWEEMKQLEQASEGGAGSGRKPEGTKSALLPEQTARAQITPNYDPFRATPQSQRLQTDPELSRMTEEAPDDIDSDIFGKADEEVSISVSGPPAGTQPPANMFDDEQDEETPISEATEDGWTDPSGFYHTPDEVSRGAMADWDKQDARALQDLTYLKGEDDFDDERIRRIKSGSDFNEDQWKSQDFGWQAGGESYAKEQMLDPSTTDITICVVCGRDIDDHSNPNTDYRGMNGTAPPTDHYFSGGMLGGSDDKLWFESHKANEFNPTPFGKPASLRMDHKPYILMSNEEFVEQEHPRDKGKFTSKGGGDSGGKSENKYSSMSEKDLVKSIKGGSKEWKDWGRNEKTEDAYAEIERRNQEIPKPKRPEGAGGKIFRDDPDAVSKMEAKVKYLEDVQDFWKKVTKFPNRDYKNHNQLGDAKYYELSNNSANLRDAKKKLEGIKAQQGRGTNLVRKPTYKGGKKRFYYSEEPKGEATESEWSVHTLSHGVIDVTLGDQAEEIDAINAIKRMYFDEGFIEENDILSAVKVGESYGYESMRWDLLPRDLKGKLSEGFTPTSESDWDTTNKEDRKDKLEEVSDEEIPILTQLLDNELEEEEQGEDETEDIALIAQLLDPEADEVLKKSLEQSPNSLMRYTEPIDLPNGKNALDQTWGTSEPEYEGQDLTGITIGDEEIIEKKPFKPTYLYYKQYPFGRRAGKQNPFGEATEVSLDTMDQARVWWDNIYPDRPWSDMRIGERQHAILAFLRDPNTSLEAKEDYEGSECNICGLDKDEHDENTGHKFTPAIISESVDDWWRNLNPMHQSDILQDNDLLTGLEDGWDWDELSPEARKKIEQVVPKSAKEGGLGSGKKDHKGWMRAIEEEHTYDFCENCSMITEQVNHSCAMCGKKVE